MGEDNFVIIVGMPGSGKTQLISEIYHDYVVYDDMGDFIEKEHNVKNRNVVFSSPHFCISNILLLALEKIKKFYECGNIDILYFENNVNKCLKNIKHRNDGRRVVGYLLYLHKVYSPPIEKTIDIYESE